MSAHAGFTPSDADRQAGEAAAGYLNRALRMTAERFDLEKSLQRDPAAFAVQFAPMLAALIETQAREYQSWVFFDRLESMADATRDGFSDLAGVLSDRLQSLDESLESGLSDLAGHWEEMNAGTCRECATRARRSRRGLGPADQDAGGADGR